MIDRSYLPYASAREYRDPGMQKWMGFFLSEHKSSLEWEEKKIILISFLSHNDKLLLLGQLYQHQATGTFSVKEGENAMLYQGVISDLNKQTLSLKTDTGYRCIRLEDILDLNIVQILED